MSAPSTTTLRVFEPHPHVLAFYEGRIPDKRLHSSAPNWLDDGAYSLGIASYAIVDGPQALVYDTGISVAHGRVIRAELAARGVPHIRVVLSHAHADHVAGTEAFADCEIIAGRKTAEALRETEAKLAAGNPPIAPLIMPTATETAELNAIIDANRG